jgi:dTDP-4-amino-4,6-dideoxygalactose transaminase
MAIPFLSFSPTNNEIKQEILSSFEEFFDSSWYILGERLKNFENEYAAFNCVQNCVGVSNGLDALHLSLLACGVGKGDEVIVPSNTYIATVLAVSYVGAIPVFVEPNINTFNIDITKIEKSITNKTKAIIPVHLYGQACEMQSIMDIANKFKLFVIEDNAQSQGASFNGKITGSWGHVNATSFYPGKNLGALGDAGAVTTNDEIIANKIKVMRNYGSQKKYFNETIGYNMRLDELQATFLSVKLKKLIDWTNERRRIANKYDEALSDLTDIITPHIVSGASHVYHLYVIRTNLRNQLQEHLTKNGIGTMIHYPIPPHLQEAYINLGYSKGDFPIAEEIAETCLSLPIWPGMTDENISEVVRNIRSFYL